ncbi:hypothetical protein ABT154_21170 [Streptomyces sp. NPDC001728]
MVGNDLHRSWIAAVQLLLDGAEGGHEAVGRLAGTVPFVASVGPDQQSR